MSVATKTALRPLGDRVVVKLVQAEEKTRGGIVLPERRADSKGVLPPISPKGPPSMQHLRVIGIRLSIAAALVAAALPVGGWKWGG